jgi:hypothetical protein
VNLANRGGKTDIKWQGFQLELMFLRYWDEEMGIDYLVSVLGFGLFG